jgi:hypothetical protein
MISVLLRALPMTIANVSSMRSALSSVLNALVQHRNAVDDTRLKSSKTAHQRAPFCDEALPYLNRQVLLADSLRTLACNLNVHTSIVPGKLTFTVGPEGICVWVGVVVI